MLKVSDTSWISPTSLAPLHRQLLRQAWQVMNHLLPTTTNEVEGRVVVLAKTGKFAIFGKNRFTPKDLAFQSSGNESSIVFRSITPSQMIRIHRSILLWNSLKSISTNLAACVRRICCIFSKPTRTASGTKSSQDSKFTAFHFWIHVFFVPKVDFNPSPLVNLFLWLQGHHRSHQHLASMTY